MPRKLCWRALTMRMTDIVGKIAGVAEEAEGEEAEKAERKGLSS
jgi:hypothetical protein